MKDDIGMSNLKNGSKKDIDELISCMKDDSEEYRHVEAVYKLGEYYYRNGDLKTALQCFEEAVKLSEKEQYEINGYGSYLPKLMMARIKSDSGNVSEAINFYMEACFDRNNISNEGYYEFVNYLKINGYESIVDEFRKAFAMNQQSIDVIKLFKYDQSKYMDYPKEVSIETTGRCNAKCEFCPHEQLDRKNIDMTDDLFLKIINDLKEIPDNISYTISPFKVNEPLMDKKFFARMDTINKELPNAKLRFFSNLNIADEEKIDRVLNIRNLKSIWISLNSVDEAEYARVMKLDLMRTMNNLKVLLSKHSVMCDKPELIIGRVADGSINDDSFICRVNDIFSEFRDNFQVIIVRRGEWIDYMKPAYHDMLDKPCLRWFELSITCTGKAALCCMDGKGSYAIGDVNEASVLDIYNGEFKRLREKGYKRKYVAPCNKCSYD
ncbi:MAG: SPASM domain-containing protein [Bacillota bacterium]